MGKTESEFELTTTTGVGDIFSDGSPTSTLYDSHAAYPDHGHGRQSSGIQRGFDNLADAKGQEICEAADMYGDVDTAEDLGYVTRGCVFSCSHASASNGDADIVRTADSNQDIYNSSPSAAR